MAKVKLGKNAYIFFDQVTGLKIVKGEVKEVPNNILKTRRVRAALNGGHLIYATQDLDGEKEKTPELFDIEELEAKMLKMIESGESEREIVKAFKLDELKALAEQKFNIEPEENDSKTTLVQAIMMDFKD